MPVLAMPLLLPYVLSGGLEVPLGGRGASTTPDGPGTTPASLPDAGRPLVLLMLLLFLLDPKVIKSVILWNVFHD